MKSPRLRLIFLTACIGLCLFFVLERSFLPGVPQRPSFRGFDLLGSVARLVKNDYLEERDPARTLEGACRGLIDSLDPVSSYFGRDATAKYLRRDSRWADIGVVLFKRSHGLFPQVAGLVEGSPAEKAGVRLDDTISAMDGRGTLDMSSLEANLHLKDLEQKPVALKVVRDDKTLEITVPRAVIFPEPFAYAAEGAFAVLEIHGLYAPCVDDIGTKVVPLLKARKAPYVLDLRNCSEGEIEEAQKLLNVFVQSPKIGDFEKKGGIKEPVACAAAPDLDRLPVAVWVNGATMGPAELVAAVLQETRKVRVIGAATPGLVSRQELFPLEDDSSVLVTSGVFTLASGKKLWEEGVTPDDRLDAGDQGTAAYVKRTSALLPKR
jgi:carboxyl-terminal processing protease